MLEEVLEKLRQLALVKYHGVPEEVRDFEVQTHYFTFMFKAEDSETELEYREVKGKVIDMWFEGTFQMKEKITLEDLYIAREAGQKAKACAECEDEEGPYVPPPDNGKTKSYVA